MTRNSAIVGLLAMSISLIPVVQFGVEGVVNGIAERQIGNHRIGLEVIRIQTIDEKLINWAPELELYHIFPCGPDGLRKFNVIEVNPDGRANELIYSGRGDFLCGSPENDF